MSRLSFLVAPVTFHILRNHMWLVATILGNKDKEYFHDYGNVLLDSSDNLLMQGKINVCIDWQSDYLCSD